MGKKKTASAKQSAQTAMPHDISIVHAADGAEYARRIALILDAPNVELWDFGSGNRWISTLRMISDLSDSIIFIVTPSALRSGSFTASLQVVASSATLPVAITFDQRVSNRIVRVLEGSRAHIFQDHDIVSPSSHLVEFLPQLLAQFVHNTVGTERTLPAAGESRPLNEGKLILVGRGEVGKTSLVKRLVRNKFSGDESKTQGINITNWPLKCGSTTYRLNIWDFGGQEIMHATHQFFLTERSLYLLVLNGREGGEDLDAEYWLKHIDSFGGESPVIVVQNKIGQHPFDLNYRGLQGRYPQIREFVKTDCSTKAGLKELRAAIRNVVKKMPEMAMDFPSDWFSVKERLETMPDEFMSYEQFRQFCRDEGVGDDADRDTLAAVLHCLGIALNYRQDPRLRETSVLKPEWVTQGIYRILNATKLAEQQGELHLDDLKQLLPKERYPVDKHLFLLELMRKFSLCFAFPDQTDRYLVPELLGKEEPAETREFAPLDCLNFEYHYGVLPEGLIPRFIVRSHTLSRGQARWRSGVILAYEDCKALVTALPAERRIIVRVKNGDAGARRRLLALIRYDFEGINAEFNDRLEAQAKVPLKEDPAVAIDYRKLRTFEQQGVTEFPELIGDKIIKVNVAELLNGIDLREQREIPAGPIVQPKTLFFSYSHRDEALRDELETHLKLLERLHVITTWYDRKILGGQEWDDEIDGRLETANIILLLVSAGFLASDYIWGKEVKRAMERHRAGEATVIPIKLRECDWSGAPFEKLQGFPKDLKPVASAADRDAAWSEVSKAIRAAAKNA
ncbi:MAG TPA: COR domain-containing protein [Thermoanaerobaculia bacterium]|nr:COR domain-containing protein [Thermoanaerobaculia bacterium]